MRVLWLVAVFLIASCSAYNVVETPSTPDEAAKPRLVRDGGACGGPQNIQCANPRSYCAYHSYSCGAEGQMGVCQAKPQICTTELHPVCGCNGETYSNFCAAGAAGQNAAYDGGCKD